MTWRRRSGCTVASLGVGRGALVLIVAWHLACNDRQWGPHCCPHWLSDVSGSSEFLLLLSITCHIYVWFACFTVTVTCWEYNESSKGKNFSLVELSVCWWVGDEYTVADSLCLGNSHRAPSTLGQFEAHLIADKGELWLPCYCLLLNITERCFQIKGQSS